MNIHFKNALKSFMGTFIANLLTVISAILTILILPKFFGVEQYAYWQLYLFYTLYVGFMHFGWADGIYLRYGGEFYDALDKRLFSTQFWLLAFTQLFLVLFFILFAGLFTDNPSKAIIFGLIGVNCLLLNNRTFLQYILLSTDRIIVFSKILIVEKIIFFGLTIGILTIGLTKFEYLLAADIIAKTVMIAVLVYACRDIVFARAYSIGVGTKEAIANISVGVKLMFANIAGMLVIGIVRYSIEDNWNIQTFGKISLTLSVASLVMVFISSASIVIFPIIKRASKANFPKIYSMLRVLLMIFVLGALVLYYPSHYLLSIWLPAYSGSLVYMAILFTMCVFESKMVVLINTYLKALRKEGYLLKINILTVLLTLIGVAITAYWLNSLTLTVLLIVIVLAVRAAIAEVKLSRILEINNDKDIILELLLTATFILTSWFAGGIWGASVYLICYTFYVFLKRHAISDAIKLIRI